MSQDPDQIETLQQLATPQELLKTFEGLSSEAIKVWLLQGLRTYRGSFVPVETKKAGFAFLDEHRGASYYFKRLELLTRDNASEKNQSETQVQASAVGNENRGRPLEILRAERDKLATENQLLQSRVSELRRTAARETQRYDQIQVDYSTLQKECTRLHERSDHLVDCLNDRAKANDNLQSALISKLDGRLRMTESYEGVVEDVDGDKVLVIYHTGDRIIEQTYEKSQFIDGRLPSVGTRLVVCVNVAEVQPKPNEPDAQETDPIDDPAHSRRKPLSGTVEF